MKTVIVGAGIAGLAIGSLLRQLAPQNEVLLLEKSRGVGGRIATRRTDRGKFDHGAQFYTQNEPIGKFHRKWQSEGLVEEWFRSESGPKYVCRSGMTAIAKNLAADLPIELEMRAVRVSLVSGRGWEVEIESHAAVMGDRVILTAPMPQNLEILDRSGIPVTNTFRDVKYAKAIVLMFEGINSSDRDGEFGFRESINENIFSIANQFKKRVHSAPSWTVVMTPSFSDRVFEKSDDEILSLAISEVIAIEPGLTYEKIQLKKWRYSHPLSFACDKDNPMFSEVSEGLFLAGDSFGGASVAGAVASATQLAQRLLRENG